MGKLVDKCTGCGARKQLNFRGLCKRCNVLPEVLAKRAGGS